MAKVKQLKDVNNVIRNKFNLEERAFSSFKSFFIICEIFCTVPAYIHVELDPTKSLPESKCSAIGLLTVVHVIWCGAVLICILVSTYFQYTEFDTVMPIIQRALYISEYISNALNVLIATVGCYRNRKLYKKFFDRIIEVDLKLQSLRITQGFQLITRLLRILIAEIAVFFAFVLFVDFMYNDINGTAFLRSSTVYTIPNMLSLLSLAQYRLLLFMIQIRFNKINVVLGKKAGPNMMAKNAKHHNGGSDAIFQTLSYGGPYRKSNEPGMHDLINTLRSLHSDLDSLTSDVTATFGLLIMSVFVASFLILSIQIFALYKLLEGKTFDVYYFLYTVLWIVLHLWKMLLVLIANDAIIKEVSVVTVLHYLLYVFSSND